MKVLLESERLLYVKVDEKYVHDYITMLNNEEVQKLISNKRREYTKEKEIEWVNMKLENNDSVFTIIEKGTNNFVGNVELMDCDGKTAELGIVITPEMQNMHYGTEAEKRMIEYAFNELNLEYLTARVFDYNGRSLHCALKQGFVETGKTPGTGDFGDYIEISLVKTR